PTMDTLSNVSSSCAISAGTSAATSNNNISSSTRIEEDGSAVKSGVVTAVFTSVRQQKSTKRVYFAFLTERSLELHESEKCQRKKKSAKYILDLSICFNVAHHYDPKLKQCLSVLAPDESLILKGESDRETAQWYDALFSATVTARALYLGRPVLPYEFFEYVWDVTLVDQPKLKKPVPANEPLANICAKRPDVAGRQRLCFYPHTIVICKMGIEPTTYGLPKTGIPPFKVGDFFELQRQHVATFGFQEKYFIMRIGRSSPMGACEIWARSDSEEVAQTIYDKLTEIIDRETEKKKKGILTPGALGGFNDNHLTERGSPSTKNQRHPATSSESGTSTETVVSTTPVKHDHKLKPSTSSASAATVASTSAEPSPMSAREKRSILRDFKARVDSMDCEENDLKRRYERFEMPAAHPAFQDPKNIDNAIARDIFRCRQKTMGIPAKKGEPDTGARAHTISGYAGGKFLNMLRRKIDSSKEKGVTRSSPMLERHSFMSSMEPVVEWANERASIISSSAAEDETEDS
ncbi:PH domain-containing protein, partial [Aphelenchoides avenae]